MTSPWEGVVSTTFSLTTRDRGQTEGDECTNSFRVKIVDRRKGTDLPRIPCLVPSSVRSPCPSGPSSRVPLQTNEARGEIPTGPGLFPGVGGTSHLYFSCDRTRTSTIRSSGTTPSLPSPSGSPGGRVQVGSSTLLSPTPDRRDLLCLRWSFYP